MAMKAWRMVVTALGQGGVPLHEVAVDAENWMAALRQARAAIGEQGGVPTGGSCAVAPDGKVTILDPVTRRSYVITPDTSRSFRPPAPSAQRSVPADDVPHAAPTPQVPAQKKVSKSTIAYQLPPEVVARMAPAGPIVVGAALAQPSPVVQAAPAPQPASAAPAAPAPQPASAAPAARTPKDAKTAKKARSRTIAYIPPTPAAAGPQLAVGAAPAPASVPAPASASVPAPTPTPVPAPAPASVPASAAALIPAAAPVQPSAPAPLPTPATVVAAEAPPAAHLLSQRDEDPSADSPLVYRERTWVVPPRTHEEAAAQALRGELYALQQQLWNQPAGKFINLAVFDHAWTDRPLRAPLATLQWKDWRGDPEIAFPARAAASQTSAEPRVSLPEPAPTALEAPPEPVAVRAAPSQPAPAPLPAPVEQPVPHRKRSTTAEAADDRLAHAFEACQDLPFLASPADGLDFAVRLLGEIVPCEAITGALYDINTDELRLVALSGPGANERKGEAVPASAGLFAAATKLVGPLLIDDVNNDRRFDPGVDGRLGVDARTMLLHAIAHEGRLLGLLQLVNRASQPQFSGTDGNVVTYVAKQLSAFLYAQRTADKRPPAGTKIARSPR